MVSSEWFEWFVSQFELLQSWRIWSSESSQPPMQSIRRKTVKLRISISSKQPTGLMVSRLPCVKTPNPEENLWSRVSKSIPDFQQLFSPPPPPWSSSKLGPMGWNRPDRRNVWRSQTLQWSAGTQLTQPWAKNMGEMDLQTLVKGGDFRGFPWCFQVCHHHRHRYA